MREDICSEDAEKNFENVTRHEDWAVDHDDEHKNDDQRSLLGVLVLGLVVVVIVNLLK